MSSVALDLRLATDRWFRSSIFFLIVAALALAAVAVPGELELDGHGASLAHSYDDQPAAYDGTVNLVDEGINAARTTDWADRPGVVVSGASVASSRVFSAPRALRGADELQDAISGLAQGRRGHVRIVESVDELDDVFARLSRGGEAN